MAVISWPSSKPCFTTSVPVAPVAPKTTSLSCLKCSSFLSSSDFAAIFRVEVASFAHAQDPRPNQWPNIGIKKCQKRTHIKMLSYQYARILKSSKYIFELMCKILSFNTQTSSLQFSLLHYHFGVAGIKRAIQLGYFQMGNQRKFIRR